MSDIYESNTRVGQCRVCGETKDLRCGACFFCASNKIAGEKVSENVYLLYEISNPDNSWLVKT